MNRDDTIARVSLLGAVDRRPTLTAEEVGDVVDQHTIPDSLGRGSAQPGWDPTYDVNAAAAEVWRIKAGRVAGDYNFRADDGQFDKADVLAHCLAMEATYAAMAGSATGLGTSNAGTITVASGTLAARSYIDQAVAGESVLP